MSNDDDELDDYDRLDAEDRKYGTTYWVGHAEGGPIDGSEIRVEAVPQLSMRGLQVSVCVGQDVETAEWHLYALGQRAELPPRHQYFKHLGKIDGDPKLPLK